MFHLRSSFESRFFGALLTLVSAGCGVAPASPDAGPVDGAPPWVDLDASPRPDVGRTEDCTLMPVQSVSEACCEAFGIDACGGGLFCAAFDGRTIGTCYALGSRTNGQECREDAHCGSGLCGAGGHCAALPSETCNAADGCVGVGGTRYLCLEARCVASSGAEGSRCGEPSDCATGYCVMGNCRSGAVGAPCTAPTDCADGVCARGACSSGTTGTSCEIDADCASGHQCHHSWPVSVCDIANPSSCDDDADCVRSGCFMGACVVGDFFAACDTDPDCGVSAFGGPLMCLGGRCSVPL